jgi:hypothetical protein
MSDTTRVIERPDGLQVIEHGDGTRTARARYAFRVRQYHDGTMWLYLEAQHAAIPPLAGEHGFIGFDLKDGTTHEQAREFAERLNETVTATVYTGRLR